jgi:hypothetical protein
MPFGNSLDGFQGKSSPQSAAPRAGLRTPENVASSALFFGSVHGLGA